MCSLCILVFSFSLLCAKCIHTKFLIYQCFNVMDYIFTLKQQNKNLSLKETHRVATEMFVQRVTTFSNFNYGIRFSLKSRLFNIYNHEHSWTSARSKCVRHTSSPRCASISLLFQSAQVFSRKMVIGLVIHHLLHILNVTRLPLHTSQWRKRFSSEYLEFHLQRSARHFVVFIIYHENFETLKNPHCMKLGVLGVTIYYWLCTNTIFLPEF